MVIRFLKKSLIDIFWVTIVLASMNFLILFGPSVFKKEYLFMIYFSLIVGSIWCVVRRKHDMLIFLFIVSLSFSAFNINVKKYWVLLGNFIPWLMAADFLLLVLVITEIFKISVNRTKLVLPTSANKAFLMLIGWLIVSYVFVSPKYFQHEWSGFFSLVEVIRGYVIFLYFYKYMEEQKKCKVLIISLAFVVMMQFGFMVYQWITGDNLHLIRLVYEGLEDSRIEYYGETRMAFGTFAFPSIAGNIMVLIHPMAIGLTSLKNSSDRIVRFCKYLIMGVAPICVLLSGARMALVAMFFVIPIGLAIMGRRYGYKGIRRYSAIMVLFIILLGVIASTFSIRYSLIEHWKERFSFENFWENSLRFRLLIYRIGVRALKENPIMGIGWGNGDRYSINLLTASEVDLYTVGLHNGYIAILVETGVIGLFFYLFWYISLLRSSLSWDREHNRSNRIPFIVGISFVIIISMILIDTQAALLGSQTEYMHFCLCLGFLRVHDEILRKD